MLDRTIPFYNTILKCSDYGTGPVELPDGYQLVTYRDGFENDWSRMECAAGDFDSEREAAEYFRDRYLSTNRHDDLLFLRENSGNIVGSCIAWTDDRKGEPVNSLHWLIVDEAYQGKGLGRALCTGTMNRFSLRGSKPIYLHTQPWSWKAIMLYISLGFRLQKTDTFSSYTNQYSESMMALKEVLPAEQYERLVLASED